MKINKLLPLLTLLFLSTTQAAIVNKEISYSDNGTIMKGMISYDNNIQTKRPGILVVHEWWGHNDYARIRAEMLARQGYTALAVDMYGDGQTASHPDDAGKFSKAVASNMPLAKSRFEAAMKVLQDHPTVKKEDIAAIGYCFGGGIVLNMARMGVDLKGVASFHGSLSPAVIAEPQPIKAQVRVFNGADDPFVKAEQIDALKKEMKAAKVDFQFFNYPGAKHSFTNPGADDFGEKFGLPLAYNAEADKASWHETLEFFKEIFR